MIGICILLAITVVFIFAYNIISSSLPKGRLIVTNSSIHIHEPFEGLSVINLKTYQTDIISQTGRYSYMDYCKKRNSIYAVSQEENAGKAKIFEINLDTKQTIPVKLKVKGGEERKYEYLKCIPNRNAISYNINGTIFIYDFDNEKESILISDCHDYSWNMNGTKAIYGNLKDMFIHEYNLTEK